MAKILDPISADLFNRVSLRGVFLFVAAILLAIFSGLWVIIAGQKYTIMLAGAIIGLMALGLSIKSLLFVTIVMNFALLGPINYIFGHNTKWLSFLFGLLLLLKSQLLIQNVSHTRHTNKFTAHTLPLMGMGLILLSSIMTAFIEHFSPYAFSVGARNIFFMWGVFLVIVRRQLDSKDELNLLRLIVLIALLQVPTTIAQAIFVVPNRTDDAPWDAITGTFPGTATAGGDSGSLAVFLLCSCGLILISFKHNYKELSKYWSLIPLIISPIFFGETKIAFIIFPLLTIIIYSSYAKTKPPAFILSIITTAAVFAAMIYSYAQAFTTTSYIDIYKLTESIFKFSTASEIYRPGGEMGRFTALVHWYQFGFTNLYEFFLGHGLGATVVANELWQLGSSARKFYPLNLATSSTSLLLWEFGVIGFSIYLTILVYGAFQARIKSKLRDISTQEKVLCEFSFAFIVIQVIILFYNAGASGNSVPTQILLMITLGFAYRGRLKENIFHINPAIR